MTQLATALRTEEANKSAVQRAEGCSFQNDFYVWNLGSYPNCAILLLYEFDKTFVSSERYATQSSTYARQIFFILRLLS